MLPKLKTFLVAALLGCLVGPMVVTAAFADTVVTMWTFLDPAKKSPREVALKQLIDRFEAANPGIRIKVEPQVFSELSVKFILGHNTGNAPDTVFLNSESFGAVMGSGAAADLQALFIKNWPKGEDEDFYIRAGWDAALVNGKRYAVPLFHATDSIFIRKDLLAAAGLTLADLKTWDSFTAAAQKLTRNNVWGFGTPLSTEKTGGTTALLTMILGGQPDAWDRDKCEARYNTPTGRKTVQLHADWISKFRVMPKDTLVNNADDLMDQFAAGRYAMVLGPYARYTKAQQDANWDKNQLAIIPFPNWTADRSGPQRVAGWWVAAWSKSPRLKEAGKWIELLVSREGVKVWSVVGGQIPTRTSEFKDPEYRKPEYDYMRTAVDAWREWSWILPVNCNTSRFDADLNLAVARVAAGDKTPEQALIEAEKKFEERQ